MNSNTHTHCLITAAQRLGYKHILLDKTGVFLKIITPDKPLHFIANQTPYNSRLVHDISQDKARTHDLLHKHIRTPLTLSYLDPKPHQPFYQPYIQHTSPEAIATNITSHLDFPLITKPNRKSEGLHVFLVKSRSKLLRAITTTFAKTPDYDFMLIAQPYLHIQKEYRVIVFQRQIILTYQKDNSQAQYNGNLSPLHWQGARAIIINDPGFTKQLQTFIQPIFQNLDLVYAGLDIIQDEKGQLWLLEINCNPGFNHLVASNGPEPLIHMYQYILQHG